MKRINKTEKMWLFKSASVCLLLMITSFFIISCFDKKISIGFVTRENTKNQKEIQAAYSFLQENKRYESKKISLNEIAQDKNILSGFDLILISPPK